jgi:hypothetical protein
MSADDEDTDTPEARRFKEAILAVCREHDMHFGIALNGELGIWSGSDTYRLERIRWARDLSTHEAIAAFAKECGVHLSHR